MYKSSMNLKKVIKKLKRTCRYIDSKIIAWLKNTSRYVPLPIQVTV